MSVLNGTGAAAKQPSPPSRPSSHHQIKRSLTDLASPSKFHRRPYLLRRQNSQQEDRERPPLLPVSPAMLAAHVQNSAESAASTGPGSLMSTRESRQAQAGNSALNTAPEDDGRLAEPRQDREAGLLLEREQASLRTDGLKQSLKDLNSLSTAMTKRLDDTYYSVLERMSNLQNTVAALRDLAQSSHDICETFDRDARDLESDIIRQLSAAGQFEDKQRRIAALQKRMYEARDRIAALASRVDAVQNSVERWEEADMRWQEKTRKRLKIIWSATTVLTLIVIAFVIGMNYASRSRDWSLSEEPDVATSPNIPPWLDSRRNESCGGGEEESESGRALLRKAPLHDAEELHAFDEL